MNGGQALRRVVIVDDDVWVRAGRASGLVEAGAAVVEAVLSHDEALEQTDLWATVDVVLVDAWDHRAGFDQFPGVAVVEWIRQWSERHETIIVVVTGHVVNDMLRLRMAEAGADAFYGHDDVSDVASLVAALVTPRPDRRPAVDHDRLRLLEARPGSRPNAVLGWIRDHGLEDAFSGKSQKALPVSRRTVMAIRRETEVLGKLAARPPTGSSRPMRSPSWQQVVRFVNRARGAVPPEHRDPNSGPAVG